MNCERMNIVVASDENYIPHLETLLVSLAEHHKQVDVINILVLDGGISSPSKDSMISVSDRYRNIELSFYKMDDEIITELLGGGIRKDRSLSTYARVFIPNIIKEDRALYLDVDAVVLDSLTTFYNTDIERYAIAGVKDTNPIERHRNVGLEDSDVYINAGVILWNLKKCREIDSVKQCVDFVRFYNGDVDAMDQGTINGVFGKQGLIKPIHPRYNAFTSLFQLRRENILKIYGLSVYYSDSEITEARVNPAFVHFTPNMTTRPWVKHCRHPLRDMYWHYRRMTSHKDKILLKDERKIYIRILGIIYRNCPALYSRIVSKI